MTTAALRIVLTGATGGIGHTLATSLAAAGHRLSLIARHYDVLEGLRHSLTNPERHRCYPVDLCSARAIDELCLTLRDEGVDVLINNAGCSEFAMLEDSRNEDTLLALNLLAPIRLCRGLLPMLTDSQRGRIINIGSSFGSIGYPGFSLYCASKFGLRGFSEALQRELSDSGVVVNYLAPRAVATDMNSAAVVALNRKLGNTMDDPQRVADALLSLLVERTSGNRYLGWPERFFIRLNALLPALVGSALQKQLSVIRSFAKTACGETGESRS